MVTVENRRTNKAIVDERFLYIITYVSESPTIYDCNKITARNSLGATVVGGNNIARQKCIAGDGVRNYDYKFF